VTRPVFLLEFHDLLVDTRAARFAALREALQHEGIAINDDVYDARFAGLSIADAVRAAAQGTALELDETGLDLATMRATAAQMAAASRGITLMPGAAEFVRNAASRAVVGLVAATSRTEAMHVVELAGLADQFSHIGCEDDGGTHTTLAERWQGVRRRLVARVSASEGNAAVMIALCGTGAGIDAAKGPGVRVFATGAVAASIAFRSDGWIPTLERLTVSELLALEAHSE